MSSVISGKKTNEATFNIIWNLYHWRMHGGPSCKWPEVVVNLVCQYWRIIIWLPLLLGASCSADFSWSQPKHISHNQGGLHVVSPLVCNYNHQRFLVVHCGKFRYSYPFMYLLCVQFNQSMGDLVFQAILCSFGQEFILGLCIIFVPKFIGLAFSFMPLPGKW